jgi:hypothetical protein
MPLCNIHNKDYHTMCVQCALDDIKPKDVINKPEHYNKGGVECIDAITEAVKGLVGIEAVCIANVIKYLWRWKTKNGLEDLKKAQWYLQRLINVVDTK